MPKLNETLPEVFREGEMNLAEFWAGYVRMTIKRTIHAQQDRSNICPKKAKN
ncbi:MAG: hypothetical protein IJF17_02885 [Thermoguttaceae bacterium]|nr:hypothetical protein [Thermoguttaceae bacterium]